MLEDKLGTAIGIGAKLKIRVIKDTIFKRLPADSTELTSDKRQDMSAGVEIAISRYNIQGNHCSFDSVDTRYLGHGYAFLEHVEIVGDIPSIVSQEQAEYIFETSVDSAMLRDLNRCLTTFGITEKEDIRQFLAQCAHESGGLRWLKELASGDDYEWREDLGNTQPGDGRKYKGGGVIQLTGRENYTKFADFMGDPEIVNQGVNYVAANYPASSAGFWWRNNNMSQYIADGATVQQVSTRVNGANPANGLADRIYYYERAKEVIK